ncbi:uncharacterized protein EAE98_006162 [Botrytis deweyae]|uniref:Terpene synthase n=1 Tax=Botrytis deweyae TaxID=2478750 RepID=A0ABQ7ILU0_9HELO|nr:uncharacterized protein EAE98_006162 [Botrytis deweyae]KAF7927780.1 hypothetical protein EAE98_006162 [Botrytis deweyae]
MESFVQSTFSPLLRELFCRVKRTCSPQIYEAVLHERDGLLTRDDDCVSFESTVRQHFYEQPWINQRRKRFEAIVFCSCAAPRMWFSPRLPRELEIMYTIYFIYTFLVDDEEPQVSDYTSLVTMETAPTSFMASFRSHLDTMKKHFSDEEYWYFLKGVIDFILMTRIEHLLHGRCELERYMSFVNDLCSWYKERVVGDEVTYEEINSHIQSENSHKGLQHLLDEAIGCMERCREICSDETEILKSVDYFLVGYFQWHLVTGRYKLAPFLQINISMETES